MNFETIVVEHQAATWSITLNRPDRKNAISEQMYGELKDAVRLVSDDRNARVVVLTGSGGSFCSGADVGPKDEEPIAALTRMRDHSDLAKAIFELRVPTIASVDGPAVGAGCNLALICDLVLASNRSFFAELFVHRAMGFDWGGSWLLPRLVGMRRAKEIALFGDRIAAVDAAEMGLINRAVEPEDLASLTQDWAHKLATSAPLALTMLKEELHASIAPSLPRALQTETYGQVAIRQSIDAAEGFASFRERRAPQFRGL